MKKFEYHILEYNAHSNDITDILNGLGELGWELVSVTGQHEYVSQRNLEKKGERTAKFYRYHFKRELKTQII